MELAYANHTSEPKYKNQESYSDYFHYNEDDTAEFFVAFGRQLDILGVFSISQYIHEKLEKGQSDIDSVFDGTGY